MNRQKIKQEAREDVRSHFLPWLVIAIITILISFSQSRTQATQGFTTIEVRIRWLEILELVFAVSFARLAIDLVTKDYIDIKNSLFNGHQWGRNILSMFLVGLYTLLWTFLFIIPGIVKWYSYSLTPYILAENDSISANDAIAESVWLTDGYKMELFLLDLSFILWDLAAAFTFGLVAFYSVPYRKATWTRYYLLLSARV